MIGDLLVGLDEHTLSGRPLAHGHEYLISDFPLTREVVDSGEPRWISRLDADADENESALLAKLGFESLLMVCLPTSDACWGLARALRRARPLRRTSAPSSPPATRSGSASCSSGWSRRDPSEPC